MKYISYSGYLYVTSDSGITIQESKELVSDDRDKLIEEIKKQMNEGTINDNPNGRILGGVFFIQPQVDNQIGSTNIVEIGNLDESQLEEVYKHIYNTL